MRLRVVVACAWLCACAPTDGDDPSDKVDETDEVVETDESDVEETDREVPDETDVVPSDIELTVRVVAPPSYVSIAGGTILVHNAEGATVQQTVTDDAGEVVVSVPAGGAVSYVETSKGERRVQTTFDAPDAATITFTSHALQPEPDTSGSTIAFTVNATGTPAGVVLWDVHSRCLSRLSETATGIVQNNAQCTSVTVQDVVVVGFDADGVPVAAGSVSGVAVEAGGVVVNVPMAAVSPRTISLSVSDAPAEVEKAYLNASIQRTGVSGFQDSAIVGGFGATLERELVLPGLSSVLLRLSIELVTTEGTLRSTRVTRAKKSELAFDAGALARIVPQLDDADPTRPVARWVLTPGTRGTVGNATMAWSPPKGEAALWSATFDPTARMSVPFPEMPAGLEVYQPTAEDSSYLLGVAFSEGTRATTYGAWIADDGSGEEFDIITSTGEP